MEENIKYFKTLNNANGYIINDIPFTCYIKENEQVLFNNKPNKMLIGQNGQIIIHDIVDVIFETLNDADGYIIETIPFSCYIKENYQFLECNQENYKIVVENGVAVIKERCNIIRYTATSKVMPYQPSSLPTIISNDFDSNTGQGIIKFATDVESIGDYAFYNCSGLTSVTIPNSVTSIGVWAFSGCNGLTSIDIPISVTSIRSGAFNNCWRLTSVTIPISVTNIQNIAFGGCDKLTSIIVENGNSIYDSRNNCNAIIETTSNTLIAGCRSTIIPNSVVNIGVSAFSNCRSLTSVIIPISIINIKEQAFSGCRNLTSVTISNSITSIGNNAFSYCNSLTSISYTGTISQYKSIYKGSSWHTNVPSTVVHCTDGDTPI